jgi:hypothetical protein
VLTTSRGAKRYAEAPTAANPRAIEALLAKKKRDDTVLVPLADHRVQLSVKGRQESFFYPADSQLKTSSELASVRCPITREPASRG